MTDSDQSWKQLCQIAVKGAEYNSRERQPHPKCLPRTRVEFLAHINELLDSEEGSRIIWINGMAGVGKSAVAFTIADRMRGLKVTEERPNEKRLAGTFFFSRKYTNRCMTGYFFATLVCQLATNFPSIRGDVSVAINNNPSLLDPDKPLPEQMEALFLEPLRRLQHRLHTHPPIVFVIDALDECTSEAETTDLVSLLGQALRDPGLPVIHILLTSRPEAHLSKSMQEVDVRPLVHEIPVKISGAGVTRIISLDGVDVGSDICIFLQDSFETLRGRYPDFPQPTQDVLKRLASRAGRRFIVASTMIKFIYDGYNNPRDRLELMLELTSKLLPGTEVFKLYDHIISTCADPLRVYQHLSVVATLANPLPMAQISELLGPGEGRDVEKALVQLRSLIDIPTNPELPVGIYHSSVRDYVSDPSHCGLEGGQCITPAHSVLARASFHLMINYIPESMGLLDALSVLHEHHQAVEPQDPRSLVDMLEVINVSASPLDVLMALVWFLGDRNPQSRSWLSTRRGYDWLNTQEGLHWLEAQGLDWLQTQEGGKWLAHEYMRIETVEEGKLYLIHYYNPWLETQSGKVWLNSQSGWNWLQTKNGHNWLYHHQAAIDWLNSSDAQTWLDSPGGKDWLSSYHSNLFSRTYLGENWLQLPSGLDWLQSPNGNKWLRSQNGCLWLNTWEGRQWLQSSSGNHWLSILKYDMLAPNDADDFQENLNVLLVIPGWEGWSQTQHGAYCLETAISGDWLSTEGGERWLRMTSGRYWIDTQNDGQWLATAGNMWLHGDMSLLSPSEQEWLQAESYRILMNKDGQAWLMTQDGQEWLRNKNGQHWLRTESGQGWLQTMSRQKWLQAECVKAQLKNETSMTEDERKWLQTSAGQGRLQTSDGQGWLKTEDAQRWLITRTAQDRLQSQSGREWLKTEDAQVWAQTEDGQKWQQAPRRDWLQVKNGNAWLQTKSREEWLETEDGREWLQTDDGQHWVCWHGASWLSTKGGKEWLESEGIRVYQSSPKRLRAAFAEAWLRTEIGREWLKTESGRSWLGRSWMHYKDAEEWLNSQSGHEWVQTRDGQQWLDTENGQSQVPWGWLDTQSGKEWLQSPSGYHWQRSHHAKWWLRRELDDPLDCDLPFWLNDFLETLEAITNFIIVPGFSFQVLPPFQAIQQFKSLPNFLMFPVFLALTPQTTSLASECEQDADMEVFHATKAFVSFTDEARERIRTSGALTYACQNWAKHLVRAPNRRDEKLDHLFDVFWNNHLLSWLERQWISKGLRSCLPVLSEAQTVVAKKLAESPKSDPMQDIIAH